MHKLLRKKRTSPLTPASSSSIVIDGSQRIATAVKTGVNTPIPSIVGNIVVHPSTVIYNHMVSMIDYMVVAAGTYLFFTYREHLLS